MDRWLRAYLVWWHGEGAEHQKDFYRCNAVGCGRILSWRHLQTGGCPCGGLRLSPSPMPFSVKFRALVLPWTITPWAVRRRALQRARILAARAAARGA